jgi:hypothetical protein
MVQARRQTGRQSGKGTPQKSSQSSSQASFSMDPNILERSANSPITTTDGLPLFYATALYTSRAPQHHVQRISKLYSGCIGNPWALEATIRMAREEIRFIATDFKKLDYRDVDAAISLSSFNQRQQHNTA